MNKDTKDWKEKFSDRELLRADTAFGRAKGTGNFIFTEAEIDSLLKEAREYEIAKSERAIERLKEFETRFSTPDGVVNFSKWNMKEFLELVRIHRVFADTTATKTKLKKSDK